MTFLFSLIMLINGTLGLYFACSYFWDPYKKYIMSKTIAIMSLGSAVWSFGFAFLFIQTDTFKAYICRTVGMVGVYVLLICAQILIGYLSEFKTCVKNYFNYFSFLGIVVYFFSVLPSETIFSMTDEGMGYRFKSGFANNIYTLYVVLVALHILILIIYMMRNSATKRNRAFGRYFLMMEIIVVLGMTLDTIFPLFGYEAIPGSSITQFWGLLVLIFAVKGMNRSRITIPNMSEFVYRSISMPVLMYDSCNNKIISNEAADRFFDMVISDMAVNDDTIKELFNDTAESLFSGPEDHYEKSVECNINNAFCTLDINRIRDGYGDAIGYIIFIIDQTERIRYMESLREAKDEAERANRAKSSFLASMSHEIRTPMNAITGFSELLLKLDITGETREYAEDIRNSANNLLAIINDMLDISKIESGKMELVCDNFETRHLINECYLIIETLAVRKNLKLFFETDEDIPSVLYGDETRLRGVLINMLNNAVKYTREGSVTLRSKMLGINGSDVSLRFEIEDTGIGIKPGEEVNIFESFSQIDKELNRGIEGTGLGLAIVKGYVELMGGKVWVESEYGKGSTFIVELTLPAADKSPVGHFDVKPETAAKSSIGNINVNGTKILVVDDNLINMKVISRSLKVYGFDVHKAFSGMQAVELCRYTHFPIILMDHMMPEMDGVEAMKRIRGIDDYYAAGGEGKIIVLTANAISGIREQMLEYGFDEYLSKPVDYKMFEELLLSYNIGGVCHEDSY